MEEEGGVKAPVTRLRRRLSVELSDDIKSPSTPSTPTKKRGGRLAAKPQLELIDEHAITNSPKRATRKSISRDVAEADEKPATPARRSTRIKSNTTLVSEVEEKPMTPAKRNMRVKSNTSIVLETAQAVLDSPRAKRAARRTSQASSDSEAPFTPARTRITRKISSSSVENEDNQLSGVSATAVTPGGTIRTTSIDNPAETQEKPTSLITEIISEEPESKLRKSSSNETPSQMNDDSSVIRRSPRIIAKKNRKSTDKTDSTSDNIDFKSENNEKSDEKITKKTKDANKTSNEHEISLSSAKLIKDLDYETRGNDKNKSMSDIDVGSKKRNRTKSWTTLAGPIKTSDDFHSDNETVKKNLKIKLEDFKRKSNSGSGDGPENMIKDKDSEEHQNMSNLRRKSKNTSISDKMENTVNVTLKDMDTSNESNKENILEDTQIKEARRVDADEFETFPVSDVKSLVSKEDEKINNSNGEAVSKKINSKTYESEDQCVPVVLNHENADTSGKLSIADEPKNIFAPSITDENSSSNDAGEPMDIDETIPENLSCTIFDADNLNTSLRSHLSSVNDSLQKVKRKSSVDISIAQENEISGYISPEKNRSRKSSQRDNNANDEALDKSKRESLLLDSSEIKVTQSDAKDTSKMKSRKSSLTVTQDNVNISKDSPNKSKRKSTVSQSQIDEGGDKDPENISIPENKQSKRKSSINISVQDHKDISTRSKKKSLSNTLNQDLEQSGNENKSTLVLSHIKDISTTESNSSKSQETKELSKSTDIPEIIKDGLINKNISVNYQTSTPVQQKSLEKLAIQMNTSVITPTNNSKRNMQPKSYKNIINKSSSKCSDANDSSDDSDDSSYDNDDLLDGTAVDAGDDYESGDSRDEEERLYEEQHEIVDEGETLTSEDDMSDDTDYERDSFVVSLDAEDYDLLSGTGDDVDMSDNELTMSKKSKKKYNERQTKKQKAASREMYEARHRLKKTGAKTESKNTSRLDPTLFKSDDDNDNMPPKKNKRMRLESTLESSQAQSELETTKPKIDISTASDVGYKKKKSKRLSESVCNETVCGEKEITINQNVTIKDDPLMANIKTEPKTPLKDLDISRVAVMDGIEEVQVSDHEPTANSNETSDPLHTTVADGEDGGSDNDSISENEEIANNYDSMLKHLNKENKSKNKTHSLSLNLNKKMKQKSLTIVDELNLTQTRKSNKKGKDDSLANEKRVKRVFKKLADNDSACSDSIDLKLLFCDDSNEIHKDKQNEDEEETFIPLRKSIGKTDIRKSMDKPHTSSENSEMNISSKNKRNSRKSETSGNNGQDTGVLSFFIDTKGDLEDKNNEDEADSDAPTEILYTSNRKNKEASANTNTTMNISGSAKDVGSLHQEVDTNIPKTPVSAKKKKKLSESQRDDGNANQHEVPEIKTPNKEGRLAESAAKTPASGKKKKKSITQENMPETSVSETVLGGLGTEKTEDAKSNDPQTSTDQIIESTLVSEEVHTKKRKRKSSANTNEETVTSQDAELLNVSGKINESMKGNKHKKIKSSNSIELEDDSTAENEKKNNNKSKKNKNIEVPEVTDNPSAEPVKKTNKKRKERDDDEGYTQAKVLKEHSFHEVHVPRLPSDVIKELDAKPRNKVPGMKKSAVSTANFVVEDAKTKRKNKPSVFLEESVYLNKSDSDEITKKKPKFKKPKVLPFLPTVSTSDKGFTTNFKVNVISQKVEFVGQNNELNVQTNFKNDYILNSNKIKKLRTYDMYKKQRRMKLTKY